jgi:hypothetical protein
MWKRFQMSGRLIPIHPSLRAALAAWRKMTPGTGPVIRSERGGPMTPVSIVNWFAIAYRAVGLVFARPCRRPSRSKPPCPR